MQPFRSQMWALYDLGGHRVQVIQQWRDPFGRPMVRVETTSSDEHRAEGLPDAVFVARAAPVSIDSPPPTDSSAD